MTGSWVKMVEYHFWLKYLAIYHYLQNIEQSTIVLKLEFYIKLEFMKIEFPKMLLGGKN